jgi:hypothetical protein
MTQPRRGIARTMMVVAVVVVLVVATMALVVLSSQTSTPAHGTQSGTSSVSSSSSSPTSASSSSQSTNGQAYLNVPGIYADMGYPKLTYSSYSPYLPSKPNYTMEYQTTTVDFQVGSVGGDVLSLNQAVDEGAEKAGLNPSNFSLAEADFEPGVIVNSTLSIHPEWILFFAQLYDGYWLWGDVGNSAVSIQVDIDALNGTASVPSVYSANGATPPSTSIPTIPASGQFELNVNSSQALDAVRNSNLSGIPEALSAAGSVTSEAPRVVLFGSSSNNEAFVNPVNSSFDGHYALCWVVTLFSPTPGYGYQGTFAVDGQTGELVSGWAQNLYPNTLFESVVGSPNYSSGSNLTVSQEVFQIDGSVVGSLDSLSVTVPNVVVVSPGSAASIGLNFSSTMTESLNATLTLANPLPGIESLSSDGAPQGVSIQFEPPALVVPGNESTITPLTVTVDKNAPSGTYLIEVSANLYGPQGAPQGTSEVLFFLSVWNGTGQWPPPPTVN